MLTAALATMFCLLAPSMAKASPVDGVYEAPGPGGFTVRFTVSAGGTRITTTNAFIRLSDYCTWGGAWNAPTDPIPELPPIEIAPGGGFDTFGGPESAFGVTSTWTGSFTSPTTFAITVVLDKCPFGQGSRTATFEGALTDPAVPAPIGPILPPSGVGGGLGGGQAAVSCTADQVDWPVGDVPPSRGIAVGRAIAVGCFTDAGSGVFTTQLPARVGGFSVVPRQQGDGLRVDTRAGTVTGVGSTWALLDRAWDRRGVPPSWLPVGSPSRRLALPTAITSLVELPVAPTVEVTWDADGRGATVTGEVSWDRSDQPEGSPVRVLDAGLDGSIELHLSNADGLELRKAAVRLKEINLLGRHGSDTALIRLRNVGASLELTDQGRLWTFSGGWQTSWRRPGALNPLVVTLRVFWLRGLAGAGGDLDNVELPIPPPGTVLERVGIDLLTRPQFGFRLSGAARLGPRLKRVAFLRSDPIEIGFGWFARGCPDRVRPVVRLSGTTTVPPAELLKGKITANLAICTDAADWLTSAVVPRAPTLADLTGDFDVQLPLGAVHFVGKGAGWSTPSRIQIEADGTADLLSFRKAEATMLLSERALVVCARPRRAPDIGIVFSWSSPARPFAGCDLGPYRRERPSGALAAQARGASVVRVRPGRRTLVIRAGGAAGAPRLRIAGPGGLLLESPESGDVPVREDAIVVRVPEVQRTFARIDRPRPGTWTVEALTPGPPLGTLATADTAAPVRASASVDGRGARRTLVYHVRPQPGRAFELWDRAAGAGRLLRRTRGGTGRLGFRPVSGGRRHRIELIVVQEGVPIQQRTLAQFTRPARPRRLGVVRGLIVRRRATRLTLRWRATGRTTQLLIIVRLPDGRRATLLRRGRRATLTVPRRGRLVVRVSVLNRNGSQGATSLRTLGGRSGG